MRPVGCGSPYGAQRNTGRSSPTSRIPLRFIQVTISDGRRRIQPRAGAVRFLARSAAERGAQSKPQESAILPGAPKNFRALRATHGTRSRTWRLPPCAVDQPQVRQAESDATSASQAPARYQLRWGRRPNSSSPSPAATICYWRFIARRLPASSLPEAGSRSS